MATRKTKKKVTQKKEDKKTNNVAGLLPIGELKSILGEEMSPEAKILKLGIILGGGININPYRVGYQMKMHPAEVHAGFSELKHRRDVSPGADRDTVNIKRS